MKITKLPSDCIQMPDNPESCFSRGISCLEKGDYAEAERCFRRTLSLVPGSQEAILNLGYSLDKQGRFKEALDCYEAVLALSPENTKARYNRAIHLLRSGNLAAGFADYESRFAALKEADSRVYTQPRWDGSPLDGRSILVYCEQGFGDAIQFSRYIPLVAGLGGRVVLEVQSPLVSLLSTLAEVERAVAKTGVPPVTDFHIPLLSLPRIFGTTLESVPASIPYLFPDPSKVTDWLQMLAGDTQFRVGLVWRGSAGNPMDRDRSCPLAELTPLMAISGVSFYSLQVGGVADEIPPDGCLIDLTDHLHDFSDTAALLENLDLVISVDTSVSHLAGAMGKPVWILLAHTPDWRWMLDRNDSPWYPGARLFRQPMPDDWTSVVREIAQVLRQHCLQQVHEETVSPEMQEASFRNALQLLENNEPDSAITELNNLLLHLPDDPAVWFNLGRAYDSAGRTDDAGHAYKQALLGSPGSPAIWFALGEIRLKQKAYPEAEFCLRKACGLKPESVEILLSLGKALSEQHKKAEALECCRKIMVIKPDCSEAIYNMAFIQLRNGEYKPGFANFEARLSVEKFGVDPRSYQQPRWDGSPLNGSSILVYGEQGMGDVIQFARYIPLVADQGGKVILEVDPPLIPLFESFPGVDRIVARSQIPPLTDVYIQLLSLPYIFGTEPDTVPDRIPYIIPDMSKVARWRQRLGDRQALRVGLVWRGNPKNPRDKERSCALSTFAPLFELQDVDFYSLQVGDAAAEAASAPEGMHLADFSGLLTDLTETAALIANLDLVISVDTAVAHLAGAMGWPVWVVLPVGSEWRWIEGRGDTPWYPTMRVFEHGHDSDWQGVVQRVRIALESLLAEKRDTLRQMTLETGYEFGVKLKEAGDLEGAESCFRRIVELHPELPDPQHSLGVVLQLQGKLQEAIRHYRIATTLDPGFVRAHFNLANAFLRCGQYQNALESAVTTIQCEPEHADAHWLLGMLLLQSGDFINGWREYEWRWKALKFTCRMPDLGRPQWDGSPLEGRTLLIHMEQGRGDMIQFVRYAALAAGMGGKIVACAAPELVPLLTRAEGISLVVDRNGPLPDFDLHIPVQSLPRVLGTTLETIPGSTPYLWPDPAKAEEWRQLLAAETRFRVGLAWQGAPAHIDDRNRSCPLAELRLLLDLKGVAFYSLQFGAGSEQLAECGGDIPVTDLTGRILDFSDSAALVANLDLVISVDTSAAHLAGALGKQVWLMLPYISEWRWLLGREDSPWYPTMRLFRQTTPDGWCALLERIRQELILLSENADYHNEQGFKLLKSGFAAEAEQAFHRSLKLNPDSAETHCNRGVALDAAGRYEEALASYREALSLKPDFVQALYNMGNAYCSLNNPDAARACYLRTIELKPDFVPAHISLGEIEKQRLEFDLARSSFESAVSLAPDCADAWQGVAEICQAQEEYDQAIVAYQKVLSLDPGRAKTWNILGTVFHSLEQLDEAEACYRQSLALLPDRPTVLNNLGVVLNSQGRLGESIAVYRHLLKVDIHYPEGHWNLSVALLAAGQYPEGWREYEWRFMKTNPVAARNFPQPRWDGSSLQGRTILLHGEQGFGDTIQFARYGQLLTERGAQVIIECQVPGLKRLLHSLEGAAGIVAAGEPLPPFDFHLPMMSLPLLFGTTLETIPSRNPYLAAEPADVRAWQQRLGPARAFRVGLVWFAKQSQVLNRKRSCRLEMFAPLWQVPGVEFFSLQIGLGAEQLAECGFDAPIRDLTAHITDFADTAAFIANLDLVITIDTAAAHLAGALGARTWVLLPHVAEWRWLCQRQDSPWYPTMRLFRQPVAGDWTALMALVAGALSNTVQTESKPVKRGQIHSGLRVGLAWSGRQDNPLNRKRSCPFTKLAPLLDLPDITFYSLQLDSHDETDERLIDLTGQIHDFEDTAALIANLDLIISIDTSVAHLAAASGRPTWVLLPHVADWRWSPGQKCSAWYPEAELFRQPDFGDWDGVIADVTDQLSRWPAKHISMPQSKRSQARVHVSAERCRLEQVLESKLNEVELNNFCPDAHLNVGAALATLGRDAAAVEVFRHVLALDSEHVAGHLNLAYSLLAIGEYSEGWEHLEWRLKRLPPDLLPTWPMLNRDTLGTHPAGSTVLVHCEQGFGDTIQFSRFLPRLSEAGYRVVVSCQPPMTTLLESIPDAGRVIPHGEPLPVCDLQVLLLSLPGLLFVTRETLQAGTNYIVPGKQKVEIWKRKLE